MLEKSILAAYGMGQVEPITKGYYNTVSVDLPDPELIVGVELEIEGWRNEGVEAAGFRYVEDGSLRNGGREAISMPTAMKYVEDMLTQFFAIHRVTAANYSERCSTHVHMNVQDMTFAQLKVLCMVYQVFERLLFRHVANNREENIFCVPWYQSGLTSQMVEKMSKNGDGVVRHWIKYAALNLLPVRSQGTVEFRHLHGTCDVAFVMQWLRLISRMAVYAKSTSYKKLTETILELNTISNYDLFMADVFQGDAPLLQQGDYKAALSVGVVDTKLMLVKPKFVEPTKKSAYTDADIMRMFERETRPTRARAAPVAVDPEAQPQEAPRAARPRAPARAPGLAEWQGHFAATAEANIAQAQARGAHFADVAAAGINPIPAPAGGLQWTVVNDRMVRTEQGEQE